MKEQNFSNHRKVVPLFHFGVYLGAFLMIGFAAHSLYRHWQLHWGLLMPALILLGAVLILLLAFFSRSFALKAQDRAIRAEENLRYFAITGNLLHSNLTDAQIIALRFAPNNELLDLAKLASEKQLSANEIKKAIKNWKGDYHRV